MRANIIILKFIALSFLLSPIAFSKDEGKESAPLKLAYWGWAGTGQQVNHAGISLSSEEGGDGFSYLWFYEWHLFGAVNNKEHTRGSAKWEWTVAPDGSSAETVSKWLKLKADVTDDGADLTLQITNKSDHDWSAIAAIIPCLNPGQGKMMKLNTAFFDEEHEHTYFVGPDGLHNLKTRAIHFNHDLRPDVMKWKKERDDGNFVFSSKWPTSDVDAYGGLIIRESEDKTWVMGIAWESSLSSQGHNPWHCMHLSIGVGPLAPGETKSIRGKMYLFKGTKEDCLERFRKDFKSE